LLVLDVVYPVHSPSQPRYTIGAIALYLLAFVVVTSYLAHPSRAPSLEVLPLLHYFAAAALFWHSLFTDPSLKKSRVDWFDGGKLFVESCLLPHRCHQLASPAPARKKLSAVPAKSPSG